jgi:hypothetical protein
MSRSRRVVHRHVRVAVGLQARRRAAAPRRARGPREGRLGEREHLDCCCAAARAGLPRQLVRCCSWAAKASAFSSLELIITRSPCSSIPTACHPYSHCQLEPPSSRMLLLLLLLLLPPGGHERGHQRGSATAAATGGRARGADDCSGEGGPARRGGRAAGRVSSATRIDATPFKLQPACLKYESCSRRRRPVRAPPTPRSLTCWHR